MVTIYTSPSCTSCRKAKAWFEQHEIAYVEKNIFSEKLTIEEIKGILRMTEDGTDEIISERSNSFQEINIDLGYSYTSRIISNNQRSPRVIEKAVNS